MRKLTPLVAAAAALATTIALAWAPSPVVAGATTPPKKVVPFTAPASVAVYPARLDFTGALRGAEYESGIGIVNDTPHGEWFDLKVIGQASPWLTVVSAHNSSQAITRLFVPPLTEVTHAIVKLKVPPTLADGTYPAQLDAVTAGPVGEAKRGVGLRVGAVIDIAVHVTAAEVLNGKLVNAYTYPKIEVGSKTPFFALVTNLGNVTVLPRFSLEISRPNSSHPVYEWRGVTGEGILPDHENSYEIDWPASSTLTQTLGKYVAALSASFQGRSFGTFTIPFQLVPYGSLHRGGDLLSIKLVNRPSANGYAEVQVAVRSTGEVQEQTSFIGQLYRNGILTEPVKSPVPILLSPAGQPNSSGVLTIPVKMSGGGLYRLTGVANFGGAQSAPKSIAFRVGTASMTRVYEFAGAALAVLLVLALFLIILRRRRHRPPPVRTQPHLPPRYASTHYRPHVPPRSPVGTSSQRSYRRPPTKS